MLTSIAETLPEVYAELVARHERIGRLIAAADLRDEVRQSAPVDLAWLGVDRSDLRWAAARSFIRAARSEGGERFDLSLRRVVLLERARNTWRLRGAPGFGPDESDLVDARLAYQRQFREPAPSLAYTSPPTYGPTSTDELLRLARSQEQFEAARHAQNMAGAA